jgi:hypothetical protein
MESSSSSSSLESYSSSDPSRPYQLIVVFWGEREKNEGRRVIKRDIYSAA